MNKKIKTYTLIIVVLGIWGSIGYKIFSAVNPKAKAHIETNEAISFKPKAATKREAFSIVIQERDPFLGTFPKSRKKKVASNKVSKNFKKPIVDHQIKFKGLIKRQQSKEQVFVIAVKNDEYLMRKGQTVDSLKLIKGNAKEIVVNYKGSIKTILR